MLDKNQVISYVLYMIITGVMGYIATIIKKMKEDKNSFYNKQAEFIAKQQEALKQKMGHDEYNHSKQVAQDIIYKVEQLGKELAWDATTKHSKATEWISEKTGLRDEEIFGIIKSVVGMMNNNRSSN